MSVSFRLYLVENPPAQKRYCRCAGTPAHQRTQKM